MDIAGRGHGVSKRVDNTAAMKDPGLRSAIVAKLGLCLSPAPVIALSL